MGELIAKTKNKNMRHTAVAKTRVGDIIDVAIPCKVIGVGVERYNADKKTPNQLVFSVTPLVQSHQYTVLFDLADQKVTMHEDRAMLAAVTQEDRAVQEGRDTQEPAIQEDRDLHRVPTHEERVAQENRAKNDPRTPHEPGSNVERP